MKKVEPLTLGVGPVHAIGRFSSSSDAMLNGHELCFIPILARILELGRGPPDLVRWVQWQIKALNVPDGNLKAAGVDPILNRLVLILARLLSHDEQKATLLLGNSTKLLPSLAESRFR